MSENRGWGNIIHSLKNDVNVIAPGIHITNIGESPLGKLEFMYSSSGLTSEQAGAVDRRVARAEEVAYETCVVCGDYGSLAFVREGRLRARVFCPRHKPENWRFPNAGS